MSRTIPGFKSASENFSTISFPLTNSSLVDVYSGKAASLLI